jgi:hypothetical protein
MGMVEALTSSDPNQALRAIITLKKVGGDIYVLFNYNLSYFLGKSFFTLLESKNNG